MTTRALCASAAIAIIVCALGQSAPAVAQTNPVLEAWRSYCASLPDQALQTNCLAAASAAEKSAPPAAIAPSPPTPPSISPEAAFGSEDLDVESKAEIGLAPPKKERLDQLELEVTGLRVAGPGRLEFTLENGQVWRQQEPANLLAPAPPFKVRIQKGALGNYRLTVVRTKRTASVARVE